jgi:MarR family transcriptional regulator for hemolysin
VSGFENLGRRLGATAKIVRSYADQQMGLAGSSLAVSIILRILAEEPGLSQREVATRAMVEGPTMAKHMDRLELDGMVSRVRDERDRRVLRVRLTPKGWALHRKLRMVAAENHAQLSSIFSARELTQFEGYLDRIAAHAASRLRSEVRTAT